MEVASQCCTIFTILCSAGRQKVIGSTNDAFFLYATQLVMRLCITAYWIVTITVCQKVPTNAYGNSKSFSESCHIKRLHFCVEE